MKRGILIIIAIAMLVFTMTVPCLAQNNQRGELLGQARETDIVTYLDGIPIPAFNFENHMYIFVDDFKQYGFDVVGTYEQYIDIDFNRQAAVGIPEDIQAQKLANGQPIGEVYTSETGLRFNGSTCYYSPLVEFRGKLAVPIYKLRDGRFTDVLAEKEAGEYVNYNGFLLSVNWHPDSRMVTIDTLREGTKLKTNMGIVTFESYELIANLPIHEWFIDNDGNVTKYLVMYQEVPYKTGPDKRIYPLGVVLKAMNAKYSLNNNMLTIDENSDFNEEMISYNDNFNLGGMHVQGGPKVPHLKLSNSKTPEEFVTVYVYTGQIFIYGTDIEKLTGIKTKFNEETDQVTFMK